MVLPSSRNGQKETYLASKHATVGSIDPLKRPSASRRTEAAGVLEAKPSVSPAKHPAAPWWATAAPTASAISTADPSPELHRPVAVVDRGGNCANIAPRPVALTPIPPEAFQGGDLPVVPEPVNKKSSFGSKARGLLHSVAKTTGSRSSQPSSSQIAAPPSQISEIETGEAQLLSAITSSSSKTIRRGASKRGRSSGTLEAHSVSTGAATVPGRSPLVNLSSNPVVYAGSTAALGADAGGGSLNLLRKRREVFTQDSSGKGSSAVVCERETAAPTSHSSSTARQLPNSVGAHRSEADGSLLKGETSSVPRQVVSSTTSRSAKTPGWVPQPVEEVQKSVTVSGRSTVQSAAVSGTEGVAPSAQPSSSSSRGSKLLGHLTRQLTGGSTGSSGKKTSETRAPKPEKPVSSVDRSGAVQVEGTTLSTSRTAAPTSGEFSAFDAPTSKTESRLPQSASVAGLSAALRQDKGSFAIANSTEGGLTIATPSQQPHSRHLPARATERLPADRVLEGVPVSDSKRRARRGTAGREEPPAEGAKGVASLYSSSAATSGSPAAEAAIRRAETAGSSSLQAPVSEKSRRTTNLVPATALEATSGAAAAMGCKNSKAVDGAPRQSSRRAVATNQATTGTTSKAVPASSGSKKPQQTVATALKGTESQIGVPFPILVDVGTLTRPKSASSAVSVVKVANASLWFSLASMKGHRTYGSNLAIVDTRRRREFEHEHICNSICPWPTRASYTSPSSMTQEEQARLIGWLKSLTDLKTLLLYGSSPRSSTSERRISFILKLLEEGGAHPKEVLILGGGVNKFLFDSGGGSDPPGCVCHSHFEGPRSLAFAGRLLENGETPAEEDAPACLTEVVRRDGRRQSPVKDAVCRSPTDTSSTLLSSPSLVESESGPGFPPCGMFLTDEPAVARLAEKKGARRVEALMQEANVDAIVSLSSSRFPLKNSKFKVYEPLADFEERCRAANKGNRILLPSLGQLCKEVIASAVDSMQAETAKGKNVVVYDSTGDNFASVAAAWYLVEAGNSFSRASQFLKAKRPTISYDSYTTSFLGALSDGLHRSDLPGTASTLPPKKRITKAREFAFGQLMRTEGDTEGVSRSNSKESVSRQSPSNGIQVSDYYSAIDGVINKLRSDVSAAEFSEAISTIDKIVTNVIMNPSEEKFRTLRMSNPKFNRAVGRHQQALQLLCMAGWVVEEAEGNVVFPKSGLVQKMRDVQSRLPHVG